MAWETYFVDGFDHYNTVDIPKKWDVAGGNVQISTTVFRNAGRSMRLPNSTGTSMTSVKRFPNSKNICFGMGVYLSAAPTAASAGSSDSVIWAIADSSAWVGRTQLAFCLLNTGRFSVYTGGIHSVYSYVTGGTLLAETTNPVPIAQWFYIEVRLFIHPTAGEIEIKINGIQECLVTGVDTVSLAEDTTTAIHIGGSTSVYYIDDFYIRTSNSVTAESGGFLGDIRVLPLYPVGDGTYKQMTPSTGTDHYSLIDELTPSTTDYVSSNTAGQKDTYSFQTLTEQGSIKGVQLNVYAAKDDAGFRGIDLMAKTGATEVFTTMNPLSVTPVYKTKMWEKNPDGTDWSHSNLSATEFGVRVSTDV